MGDKHAALNAAMAFYVPELKSSYGHFPMEAKQWVSAKVTQPDGKPAFLPSPPPPKSEPKALVDGYVWGTGTLGFGYYHLTTKESYKILAARLKNMSAPDLSGMFNKRKRKEKQQLKQIEIIMYYRGESPVPNDAYAEKHGLECNAAAFRAQDDFGFWELRLK